MTKIRTIRVSDDEWASWSELAEARKISVSQLIRDAVTGVKNPPVSKPLRKSEPQVEVQRPSGFRAELPVPPEPKPIKVEKVKAPRTGMCEHRIPLSSYCPKCDG